ncbi:hypothetical protein IJI31_04760 [bacterium]|nr:hypothetical protein [bacterium]
MSSKEQIKIMMLKEHLTAKQLAEMLAKKTGKHYTHQSLLHKISLSSLRYDEIETVADILGYEIQIVKK